MSHRKFASLCFSLVNSEPIGPDKMNIERYNGRPDSLGQQRKQHEEITLIQKTTGPVPIDSRLHALPLEVLVLILLVCSGGVMRRGHQQRRCVCGVKMR